VSQQTLRRIIHLRSVEILGHGLELKLRVLPHDFAALDVVVPGQTTQLANMANDRSYQAVLAQQCFRYFDSELQYQDHHISVLLRALQASTCRQRQVNGALSHLRRASDFSYLHDES